MALNDDQLDIALERIDDERQEMPMGDLMQAEVVAVDVPSRKALLRELGSDDPPRAYRAVNGEVRWVDDYGVEHYDVVWVPIEVDAPEPLDIPHTRPAPERPDMVKAGIPPHPPGRKAFK